LDVPLSGPLHPDPPLPAEQLFARHDLPRKLSGAGFVHDRVLPGLLHARMVRGPHPNSQPMQVDLDRLRGLPGVTRVVADGGFLAIAGPDEGALVSVLDAAHAAVTWRNPALPPGDDTEALLRSLPARTSTAVQQGQPLPAAQRLRRSYSRPFIAHAAIGPSCAIAEPVRPDSNDPIRLTVWSHTQGPHKLRDQIARALGLAAAQVRVVHEAGSGCYGHNGADDAAFDAACLAHLLQVPVRVQWTRRQEFSVAPMGPASLVEIDAGLTADGHIADWQVQVWSPTHVSRPGTGAGINLLGAWAREAASSPSEPADVPLPTGGGLRNAVPGYVLPALQVVHHFITGPPLRVSALRSLGAHANVFAIESFIDELAAAAAVDPVEFRLRHLSDERARHVVLRAAEIGGWGQRPSGGDGHGLGFGYARYKNHAGYCAVVAAVRVEDKVQVERVWAVVDAGAVVHRDGLLNQIEGGIVQALSWSLKEAVSWDPEGIRSASWDDYPILGFDEVPAVAVELVDRPDAPSLGCGELAAGPVAGALGNAVAHALGLRARHLPLTAQRLLRLVDEASA
jgi:CO/xanthine dehydrogenase Mo-binding subunit